ncbi:MAG: rod-binding protein [Syntrophomonadaceae bacterium]|nr:rod-binding protein [Syntrophomonadaceae bacterium]
MNATALSTIPTGARDTAQASRAAAVTARAESFARRLQDEAARADDAKLREACRDLESVFLYQLITAMRATIPRSGFLDTSYGQQVFESMLDEEYARTMAHSGCTGLGDTIYRQLRQQYGGQSPQAVDTTA